MTCDAFSSRIRLVRAAATPGTVFCDAICDRAAGYSFVPCPGGWLPARRAAVTEEGDAGPRICNVNHLSDTKRRARIEGALARVNLRPQTHVNNSVAQADTPGACPGVRNVR